MKLSAMERKKKQKEKRGSTSVWSCRSKSRRRQYVNTVVVSWTICVPLEFIRWNPNSQCNGKRRWGLWEVTRSWGCRPHSWDKCPCDRLQYSGLENPVDRGAWWAAVPRVTQSQTWLQRLSTHACIGVGNGNPLQYSCLENPRDRRAWWAAVYGGAQSQTRLKWLSSSNSSALMKETPESSLPLFLPCEDIVRRWQSATWKRTFCISLLFKPPGL